MLTINRLVRSASARHIHASPSLGSDLTQRFEDVVDDLLTLLADFNGVYGEPTAADAADAGAVKTLLANTKAPFKITTKSGFLPA